MLLIFFFLYISEADFFIWSNWNSLERQTCSLNNFLWYTHHVDEVDFSDFLSVFCCAIFFFSPSVFWLLVSPDSHHVRITIQWIAIEKGVIDSVFGKDGQSAADDSAAKRKDRIRCDRVASFATKNLLSKGIYKKVSNGVDISVSCRAD